jgi:hypothetical protein
LFCITNSSQVLGVSREELLDGIRDISKKVHKGDVLKDFILNEGVTKDTSEEEAFDFLIEEYCVLHRTDKLPVNAQGRALVTHLVARAFNKIIVQVEPVNASSITASVFYPYKVSAGKRGLDTTFFKVIHKEVSAIIMVDVRYLILFTYRMIFCH